MQLLLWRLWFASSSSQFHYWLASSCQVFAERSVSSIKCTGECSILLATKATTRFLMLHGICLCSNKTFSRKRSFKNSLLNSKIWQCTLLTYWVDQLLPTHLWPRFIGNSVCRGVCQVRTAKVVFITLVYTMTSFLCPYKATARISLRKYRMEKKTYVTTTPSTLQFCVRAEFDHDEGSSAVQWSYFLPPLMWLVFSSRRDSAFKSSPNVDWGIQSMKVNDLHPTYTGHKTKWRMIRHKYNKNNKRFRDINENKILGFKSIQPQWCFYYWK